MKPKLTPERLEELMNQVDEIYSEIFDAGHREEANALLGANEVLFELFEKLESQ